MDSLLQLPEAAALLHLPVTTLRYWRDRGTGPLSFKIGRRVVYRESDLIAYLDAQRAAAEQARPRSSAVAYPRKR